VIVHLLGYSAKSCNGIAEAPAEVEEAVQGGGSETALRQSYLHIPVKGLNSETVSSLFCPHRCQMPFIPQSTSHDNAIRQNAGASQSF